MHPGSGSGRVEFGEPPFEEAALGRRRRELDRLAVSCSGGIRLPELPVPAGTYTGWNLRHPEVGAPDKLARWSGSFIPFAPTAAAQRASGDPRLSLEARYPSRADYERRSAAAAAALVDQRFLLADDVAEITKGAGAFYERVLAHAPDDPSCAYTLGD